MTTVYICRRRRFPDILSASDYAARHFRATGIIVAVLARPQH